MASGMESAGSEGFIAGLTGRQDVSQFPTRRSKKFGGPYRMGRQSRSNHKDANTGKFMRATTWEAPPGESVWGLSTSTYNTQGVTAARAPRPSAASSPQAHSAGEGRGRNTTKRASEKFTRKLTPIASSFASTTGSNSNLAAMSSVAVLAISPARPEPMKPA